MKEHMTQKRVRQTYDTVLSISYCHAQYLFNNVEPIGYTTRVEGWGCDIYSVYHERGNKMVAVTTGYAPFGKHIGYELVDKYEEKARHIWCGRWPFHRKMNECRKLVQKMLDEYFEEDD